MSPAELLALSLLVSVGIAGLGWLAATMLERASGDIALRERAWSLALYLPALPPLAMGLLLLTPAPVRPVLAMTEPATVAAIVSVDVAVVAPASDAFRVESGQVAIFVLAAALLLTMLRLAVLGRRARRLSRLLAGAAPAASSTLQSVALVARGLGVTAPQVRICAMGSEALLTGLARPRLVLPSSLAEASDAPAVRAVIAHELAHLKRGDHRAVWWEEILLALLAFNLILPFVRARLAAAREEACDALALSGVDAETRHTYARSLIEALRDRADHPPTPALTFTGHSRSQAMRRLQSILTPPAAAGAKTRLTALGAGVVLLALAGAGTAAVASQRQASSAPLLDDAKRGANEAAVMATETAMAALTPIKQARYRAPSGVQYQAICATGDEADQGFCSGVLFAVMSYVDGPSVCLPKTDAGEVDAQAVAVAGRRAVAEVAVTQGQKARDVADLALRRAFACQAAEAPKTVNLGASPKLMINGVPLAPGFPYWALAAERVDVQTAEAAGGASLDFILPTTNSPPVYVDGARLPDGVGLAAIKREQVARTDTLGDGSIRIQLKPREAAAVRSPASPAFKTRLTIEIRQGDNRPFILGGGDVLKVSLAGEGEGEVLSKVIEAPILSAYGLPSRVFLDLDDRFFPSRMPGRAYELKAEIRRADGRLAYVSEPTTLRLAPGSQRQAMRMRPEVILRPAS
ncbi:BlaR1 peptidase M56 [compost metagenome]